MQQVEQRSEEWRMIRCGKITASCFGDLMATTKSGIAASRKNLIVTLAIERLTGKPIDHYQNAAMLRGIELEDEARAAYEAEIGTFVEEVGFVTHPKYDFIGASPDGLVGETGLVELKCPSSVHKHADALLKSSHVDEYFWQIHGQMWITGRKMIDVVSYDPRFPEGLKLAIDSINASEDINAEIEKQCLKAEHEIWKMTQSLKERLK